MALGAEGSEKEGKAYNTGRRAKKVAREDGWIYIRRGESNGVMERKEMGRLEEIFSGRRVAFVVAEERRWMDFCLRNDHGG